MWNRPFSHFLIIRLRHKAVKFMIPVPLLIFGDIMQSAVDLASLGESLFPRLKLLSRLIISIADLLFELRRLGTWMLVEITTNETKITISFY